MNDLLRSLDRENVSVLPLLDLSAAFDTIDHVILLQRLEHVFGIHDTALHWFSSYLTNRTQTVTVNNCSSASVTISCRGPRGSVLGTVLFVLYTAPLSDVMDSHSVLHHSLLMTLSCRNLPLYNRLMNSFSPCNCVCDVKSWMTLNKLKLTMTRRKHLSYLHQGFQTLHPFLTLLLLETRQSASLSQPNILG